jgi:hypothetical protein
VVNSGVDLEHPSQLADGTLEILLLSGLVGLIQDRLYIVLSGHRQGADEQRRKAE